MKSASSPILSTDKRKRRVKVKESCSVSSVREKTRKKKEKRGSVIRGWELKPVCGERGGKKPVFILGKERAREKEKECPFFSPSAAIREGRIGKKDDDAASRAKERGRKVGRKKKRKRRRSNLTFFSPGTGQGGQEIRRDTRKKEAE